jgi:hypothetical protein
MKDKNFFDDFIFQIKKPLWEENEVTEYLPEHQFKEKETQKNLNENTFIETPVKETFNLGKDIIKTAEKITTSPFHQTQPRQFSAVDTSLNEQTDLKIEVSDPIVIKNGKLTIDQQKLSEIILKQSNLLTSNNTIQQFLKANGYDNIYGGGAVGIKTEDFEGNQVSILKSVGDIVFKGDGVTVTRNGKNIEVNIPGASVLAEDPTIDFARESTTLNILELISVLTDTVQNIQGVVIPLEYSGGIGGSTGNWTSI